jgi:2-polyprenyl-3-methyl-5-hydroxy-6-metoxy-1,4-benzoquinol methylase
MAQQNIYDNDKFFESFKGLRADEINFNDLIETPILLGMMPDLKGKRVLDVGCGMGQHAKQYSDMGALSVLGTDISEKMLGFARENNSADNIEYVRLPFEDLEKLVGQFDVVTSSLAFDYAEDFCDVLKKINALMVPGGKLVFSTSHPISTAFAISSSSP